MFVEGSKLEAEVAEDGQMARLIRTHDWGSSPLGPQTGWPRALQTTVDLMLASRFPMFVAWGIERCLIYNDAYSEILGKKHPSALGAPFREVWTEIWHDVGPIADRAFANQPSYFENMPLQMERNGYTERTYFTFSYSGVRGEDGEIEGMFCVCQETTAAVLGEKNRVDEMERLRQLFQQAPGFMAMLSGPQHVFSMVNTSYLQLTGFRDLLDKPVREAMPELAGQGLYELMDQVYASAEPYVANGMPVKVQRSPNHPLEDVFVNFVYQPIVAADGTVTGIFVEGSEVTDQYLAQQDLAHNIARLEEVERRQSFQLELADRIRDLAEPEEITAAAIEMLGRRLDAERVVYAEVNDDDETFLVAREWLRGDAPSLTGALLRLEDFGPQLIADLSTGTTVAIDDVRGDPRTAAQADAFAELGVMANLGVPLVKSGRLVAVLNVHHGVVRHWTGTDIDLARGTAESTWAALESARARAELKAERDQSQHILKNMIEGFMLLDGDARVVQINEEALALGERSAQQVLGRHHLEVWPEAAGSELEQLYCGVARTGVAATLEYEHVFPHGGRIWLEVRCHPWLEGGLAVFLRDISERKRSEESLHASEAKFRTITNAMPHMVFSTLPDGHHDYFNEQWYEFTGMPDGATGGAGWTASVHPEDLPRVSDTWDRSLASGEPYEIEFRLRHRSGQFRWVLARALPLRNEDGAIVRWMGSSTDIHDQKLTQEALRVADRRKDEFLAMLAHELRNPLAPISAGADLLRLARVDEARVRQISELISRQVKHMTSLVDDLMDVSRVTRGLVALENAMLDARHIVTDAVEQVRPLIDARGHQLAVHTPPESAFVLGDQKRLIQVITNVLNNAAKYTPKGGSIVLRMDATPTEVEIRIADNGIGMAPDVVGRVFELFTQAERTSDRSQGGLGIGLALVKSLVELHQGTVVAGSAGVDQGSEFTIRLPRVAVPAASDPPQGKGLLAAAAAPLRVMVVDDNQDAAMMLGMFLESAGHEVAIEHNARRALDRARRDEPDVCLLDIGLPDMDGNELARQMRAREGGARAVLIAITGYGQEQDRRQTTAAGFDHHFVKPVDAEALLTVLAGMKRG